MLTGYWSIDACIVANIVLCLVVIVVFVYYQATGRGTLCDQPNSKHKRSQS